MKAKEYPIEPDRSKEFDPANLKAQGFTDFVPKEEYTRPPPDPHVRPRLPDLPSDDLTRRYLHGYPEPDEP